MIIVIIIKVILLFFSVRVRSSTKHSDQPTRNADAPNPASRNTPNPEDSIPRPGKADVPNPEKHDAPTWKSRCVRPGRLVTTTWQGLMRRPGKPPHVHSGKADPGKPDALNRQTIAPQDV